MALSTTVDDPGTRLRIALLERRLKRNEFATIAELNVGTLGNIIRTGVAGTKTKKRIQEALGVQIWPDVPLTIRHLRFPAGTEIHGFDSPEEAAAAAAEYGHDTVRVEGTSLVFIKDAVFALEIPAAEAPAITLVQRRGLEKSTPSAREERAS